MRRIGAFLWVLAVLPACGGDADVEGNYTIAITNRDNGCNFPNWTIGQKTNGIVVDLAQDGGDVTASVGGATGGFLDLAFGAHVYKGTISGDRLSLTLFGQRSQNMGNCAFTFNSIIDATASGDSLAGRIDYTAAGNGNPDCATIDGCVTFQEFAGSRPPP
ncbi:MAG: hypothetical protein KF773_13435 [Deltaproteobacteria bacterium]|nr:hypothetical protein [Deltaproteobacteria bacterium]MCW5803367.1 hypothetical protein [Deltaproteobacteria bacterium]